MASHFHMWQADALGQTYTVTTKEIHFVTLPPLVELKRGTSAYGPRPDEREGMRWYRDKYPQLQLTLKELSCAPRVFEIDNFLSDIEVQHILQLAKEQQMQRSSVQASESILSFATCPGQMQGILPTFMGQIGCSVMLQPEQMQLASQAGASYASPQCFWKIVLYCDNGEPLITG